MNSTFSVPYDLRFYNNSDGDEEKVTHALESESSSFDCDPDELPAPIVRQDMAKTKLEVLQAWEINFATSFLNLAAFAAFLYIVVSLSSVRKHWSQSHQIPKSSVFDIALEGFLRLLCFLLPIAYCLSIAASRRVTPEQIWTSVLLLTGIFRYYPISSHIKHKSERYILSEAVYTSINYFYILFSIHSYRILTEKRLRAPSFYGTKSAVVGIYLILRISIAHFSQVSTGVFPFISFFVYLKLPLKMRELEQVTACVTATTTLDGLMIIWIIREFSRTNRFLAKQPYLENRTKQLGFRCFVYQSFTFFSSVLFLSLILVYFLPEDIFEFLYFDERGEKVIYLNVIIGNLGLLLVYVAWILILAFVNLPSTPIPILVRGNFSSVYRLLCESSLARNLRKVGIHIESHESKNLDFNPVPHDMIFANAQREPFLYRHKEQFNDTSLSEFETKSNDIIIPLDFDDSSIALDTLRFQENSNSHRYFEGSYCFPDKRAYPEFVIDSKLPHKLENCKMNRCDDKKTEVADLWINFRSKNRSQAVVLSLQEGCELKGIELKKKESAKFDFEHSRSLQNRRLRSSKSRKTICRKRPRVRKNLFIMETQVQMANISYLAYIPRNLKEEHLYLPGDYEPPPLTDIGTKFQVDVAELSSRHGFTVFRQISNENTNTHATILVGNGRVVVAFSGTRDKKNWETNSRIKRMVYDEMLGDFEFEVPSAEDLKKRKNTNYNCLIVQDKEYNGMASKEEKIKSSFTGSLSNEKRAKHARSKSTDSVILPLEIENEPTQNYHTFGNKRGQLRIRRNVMKNIDIRPIADRMTHELLTIGKAKVHSGFAHAYKSIRKQVIGAVMELYSADEYLGLRDESFASVTPDTPMFFCGHSLGGALAIFAAFDCAKYYNRIGIHCRNQISCSTFGCPKVGNEIFKERYEKLVVHHWRFELASDPIPNIFNFLMNYTHVGTQVLLDQSGMLLIDPSFIEKHWWGKLATLYLKYKLHIRASYIAALRSYCKIYRKDDSSLNESFWALPIKAQTKGIFPLLEE